MKQSIIGLALLLCLGASILFPSCVEREYGTIATQSIKVQIQLEAEPSTGTASSALAGRIVRLSNDAGLSLEARTDAEGIATFEGIVPGFYSASSSWELSGQEYTALTGISVGNTSYLYSAALGQTLLAQGGKHTMAVSSSPKSDLVISKVYYSTGKDNNGRNYTAGVYIELYNNSEAPINLAGYYLGLNESNSTAPTALLAQLESNQYMKQVYSFPSHTLAPGTTAVIANVAIDHSTLASAESDLSRADFEVLDPNGRIADQTHVTNLTQVFSNLKNNMNLSLSGPTGIALFRTSEDPSTWAQVDRDGLNVQATKFLTVPNHSIVDAVEILSYRSSSSSVDATQKRYPAFIDAGYAFVQTTRAHIAIARKYSQSGGRIILQDTNNSSNDFVLVTSLSPRNFSYSY